MKIGIIGTGGMANAHAEEFSKIDGVRLAACLDVVPGKAAAFAAKHGIAHACTLLDEVFAQVDAVSIVTPDAHHAAPTIAALRAGRHVLCEKPLTTSLAEARQVAAAAAAAPHLIGMVNFSYRRSAALQAAIGIAQRGELGRIRHVHAHYLQGWLRGIREPAAGERLPWRLETAAGGGVLADLGCHILDLTTAVAGAADAFRCDFATFPKLRRDGTPFSAHGDQHLDADDTAALHVRFASGEAFGVLHTTRWAVGRGNTVRLEVHGTDGALVIDLDRGYEQLERYHSSTDRWETTQLPVAATIYQRFVAAVRSGVADQPDLARGAEIQAYLDACTRSARSGAWETVAS